MLFASHLLYFHITTVFFRSRYPRPQPFSHSNALSASKTSDGRATSQVYFERHQDQTQFGLKTQLLTYLRGD